MPLKDNIKHLLKLFFSFLPLLAQIFYKQSITVSLYQLNIEQSYLTRETVNNN